MSDFSYVCGTFQAEFTSLHLFRSKIADLSLNLFSGPAMLVSTLQEDLAFMKWVRDLGYEDAVSFAKEILRWMTRRWETDVEDEELVRPGFSSLLPVTN